MRVLTQGDLGLLAAVMIGGTIAAGALIGAAAYGTSALPGLLPLWPAIAMGFAIGAMDRTSGDARRLWAKVAIGAGTAAVLAIMLT